MSLLRSVLVLLVMSLAGCGSVAVEQYRAERPALDLQRYFGEAIGELHGNTLRWQYVLKLDVDGRTWEVDFDDWMYLMDEQVMLNRSVMSKFGVRLGEVTLSFRRRP